MFQYLSKRTKTQHRSCADPVECRINECYFRVLSSVSRQGALSSTLKRERYISRIRSHLDLRPGGYRRDFRAAIPTGSRSSSSSSLAETALVYRVARKSLRAAGALVCANKLGITELARMSMAMLPYYFSIKSNDKRNVIQRTPPMRHRCWHLFTGIPRGLDVSAIAG